MGRMMSMVGGLTAERRIQSRSEAIDKAFAVFLGLYPFLCIYRFVSGLTIGDALLLLFFVRSIGGSTWKDDRMTATLLFAAFIPLSFFNLVLASSGEVDSQLAPMVIRWLRVSFYLLAALLLGKDMTYRGLFLKTVVVFSTLASLFLFFQYIAFYGMGTVIMGRIPGMQVYLEDYAAIDYNIIYSHAFRPCSFFLEPASFVQYAVVAQCALLFTDSYVGKARVVLLAVITAGAIMTTSAQGILYFALVYAVWFLITFKKKIYYILVAVAALSLLPVLYANVDAFQYAVDRLLTAEDASNARLGSYALLLETDSIGNLLFGRGFGYVPNGEWFSGAVYVLHGTGLIGFLLACMVFYQYFRNAHSTMSKVVCAVFFVMFFGTALFYNYMLFWFFATTAACSQVQAQVQKYESKNRLRCARHAMEPEGATR